MPIPQPEQGESENTFIQRCMEDDKMKSEYPNETQRFAVCSSQIGDYILNEDSYNDYPKAATENAKRALKFRDESGNPNGCGTQVGWQRANQLAKRESISRETIARMSAFSRHEQNKDVPYNEGCGGLMWDAWGGDEGIAWAKRKLDQIDREKQKKNFILRGILNILEEEKNKL